MQVLLHQYLLQAFVNLQLLQHLRSGKCSDINMEFLTYIFEIGSHSSISNRSLSVQLWKDLR